MSNHLLTIDPVLLMDETQLDELDKLKNAGEAADYISKQLGDQFAFSQVFQSTNDDHTLNVHEFMLANETGERKMHDMGTMKTPSDLLAFVTVDDEWINEHKDVINKGVHFKMDERIDPTLLNATDGQTEDGQTTSFLRYGQYKTPIMMVAPKGPVTYQNETVEDMERLADEREETLRGRKFSLDPFRFVIQEHKKVKKESMRGALLGGFMKGWDLVDNYKKTKGDSQQNREVSNGDPSKQPPASKGKKPKVESEDTETEKTKNENGLDSGLSDLSMRMLEEQSSIEQ